MMTVRPKEKAKELYDKFDRILPCEGTTTGDTPTECALISVQNTLDAFMFFVGDNPETDGEVSWVVYWEEVKTELKNI